MNPESFFQRLLTRPITVFMGLSAVLGASWIAASRIPVELIPKGFGSSNISVNVSWEGAHPAEVEKRLVQPLEQEFRTIAGHQNLNSVAMEGGAVVNVGFSGSADMDQAYAEVADRIERARPQLPTDADRVVARRWSGDSMPVMWFGIRYPIEFRDSAQRVVADVLVPRLEAVDGVASASAMGLEPRSIRILIDKETATANRLDIGGLYRRLQADNQSTPVGDLDSGGSRHIIRVEGRFESLEEIENFPIGDGLLIKDVGRVIEARSAPEDLFRIEGEYAMAMSVSKETSANTFEVCQRIETLLNETLKDDPILNVFSFEVFWSEGTSIRSSLRSLIVNALQGGLIAILILYGFLRHLGFTLLVTLSIPVSILATLAWLYFSGETFNMMSMMGITISIGMLVDNAVVIVESIVRRRSHGETIDEACVRGPAEMSLAITTATLTSIVVFLPLIFMSEDRMSKTFTHAIGIPLCVALMAALLVAQLVVPPACRYLARREKKPVLLAKPPATQGPASWMPRLVAWSLQNRLKAASLAILFLASGGLSKGQQSFGDSMGFGGNELEYRVNFTSNTTLQEAEGAMLVLEEAFDDSLLAEIGNPAVGFNFDRNRGEIKLWHDSKPSPELKDEIKAVLKERLPKHPRYEIKFEGRYDRTGTGDGWTRVALSGPESQTVDRIAREIREKALTDAAWQGIQEDEEAAREILVRLDRERLNRMGSTSRDVLGSIEYGMRGLMVSRYQTESGDLPVIMEYDTPRNPSREDLREVKVAGWEQGTPLSLSVFADFENRRAPSSIFRRDGKTLTVVGLKHASKDVRKAAEDLRTLMATVEMPAGYRWEQSGGWSDFSQDMDSIRSAFLLAVALVFLLMGLLFESLALPFSVLTTIWFSVIGANWAFKLTGTTVDVTAMIGMIVLAGLVVNNGIVLVDRIRRLEAQGTPREEAVVQAVRDRLRPVVMTAVTTIAGLLPLALSTPDGSGVSFQGLAIGVSGGLAFTTFFTLWVVPLLYGLMIDLGQAMRNELFDRIFAR